MSHLYQQYRALELDGSWIGLEVRNADPWFCTPIGAEIIGWDGAIHYCFVPGFAETVFCVNPENYGGHLVYPICRFFKLAPGGRSYELVAAGHRLEAGGI